MAHKCFISFKTEDLSYKKQLQELNIDMIDKSLNEAIDSDNEEYILKRIREDYLSDSTVTIHLIGTHSSESCEEDQRFIKRELQASLYNGENNSRSGILGIVLPEMQSKIYKGSAYCAECRANTNYVDIDEDTVVWEFYKNYYLVPSKKCSVHFLEEGRYCILTKWEEFCDNPRKYIEQAFAKREQPIAEKVTICNK